MRDLRLGLLINSSDPGQKQCAFPSPLEPLSLFSGASLVASGSRAGWWRLLAWRLEKPYFAAQQVDVLVDGGLKLVGNRADRLDIVARHELGAK